MAAWGSVWRGVRSVLAVLYAFPVLYAANALGALIAAWASFPAGGPARLAWDLAWVFASGVAAAGVTAKLAPCAPRGHVAVLFALLLLVVAHALGRLGADWPRWFGAGLLLGLPLQAWLGVRLAGTGPRRSLHSNHGKGRWT